MYNTKYMAKLPKYKITIDPAYSGGEDLGIDQIAFTANPAIKVKGMAFSVQTNVKKKFFADEVKMRIAAPALIPMEIYRADEDGEYYVEFSTDEIDAIHSKFMSNLNNKGGKFNLEHDSAKQVPAYILETWVVNDPLKDKAYSTFGIEVPKGTLMVVSQLTDKAYYTSLVDNGQVGYSIEGFLGLKLSDLINKNKLTTMKKQILSKTEKPKFKLAIISEVSTWAMEVDNTTFNVGDKVTATDDNGNSLPICDGQYFLQDGSTIFVDISGTIVLVTPAGDVATPAAPAETPAPVAQATETPAEPVAEKMAAAPATDAPAETPAAADTNESNIDEAQILAIVQPKLDEIYKMIADLKAAQAADDASEAPADGTKTKMSIHERFAKVIDLVKE